MTAERACELLRSLYGHGTTMDPRTEREIRRVMRTGEGYLPCLQRIAGDGFDWVSHRCELRHGFGLNHKAREHFRAVTPKGQLTERV